jgi:hypothetical protein
MKSSTKSAIIPPPPEKPQKNSYLHFCKEQRAKTTESIKMGEISSKFHALSEKDKEHLEDRYTQEKKEYDKNYSKWLENAQAKGYPDYPKYSKKAIKNVLNKKTFKREAVPLLALAAGAFTQAVKDSLLKYMKGEKVKSLDMKLLIKFLEDDPDKVLKSVKATKLFDKYISAYTDGEVPGSESEDEKKKDKKEAKKSSCSSK